MYFDVSRVWSKVDYPFFFESLNPPSYNKVQKYMCFGQSYCDASPMKVFEWY